MSNSGETLKFFKINVEKEKKEQDFDDDETNLGRSFVSNIGIADSWWENKEHWELLESLREVELEINYYLSYLGINDDQ